MINNPLKSIEEITKKTDKFMESRTRNAFNKYPLTFSFLVLFGVIAVLHGFEDIINRVTFLSENPLLVFVIGLLILIFTGSLYKKLNKRLD